MNVESLSAINGMRTHGRRRAKLDAAEGGTAVTTFLRCMDWLELEGYVVTPRIFEHFCEGTVYMRSGKFEVVCVPRFREIFNESAKHADMLRTCGEPSLVRLAAQFDAENAAADANKAIMKMLESASVGLTDDAPNFR